MFSFFFSQTDYRKKKGVWGRHFTEEFANNPYKARYGDLAKEKLDEALRKKGYSNITTFMAHIKGEGDQLFQDTPFSTSWIVYHDALTSWWSKEAQEFWNVNLGMAGRQIKVDAFDGICGPQLPSVSFCST